MSGSNVPSGVGAPSGPPRRLPPPPPGVTPTPTVRARRGPGAIAWLTAVAVVGLVAGGAGVLVGTRLAPEPAESEATGMTTAAPSREPITVAPPAADPSDSGAETLDIVELIERVGPSVVSITTDVASGGMVGNATGSGVIITSDGEILTNAHVVEGAQAIRVRLAGETEPRAATLVASDPGNDLALLRIDATGLPTATFATPDSVRIGQEVLAIGFALDLDGEASFTRGIVSAVDRTISTAFGVLNRMIQTDAAISSGNSGGPLVNTAGEIVGINTAVARGSATSQASNISFSISVGEVLRVVEELRAMAGGTRAEGYLGVGLADRVDGGSGAVISEVQPGTPADRAGIRVDDVVVSVDGIAIDGSLGLIAAIRDLGPDDRVSMVVLRDGERIEVETVLEARPDS